MGGGWVSLGALLNTIILKLILSSFMAAGACFLLLSGILESKRVFQFQLLHIHFNEEKGL